MWIPRIRGHRVIPQRFANTRRDSILRYCALPYGVMQTCSSLASCTSEMQTCQYELMVFENVSLKPELFLCIYSMCVYIFWLQELIIIMLLLLWHNFPLLYMCFWFRRAQFRLHSAVQDVLFSLAPHLLPCLGTCGHLCIVHLVHIGYSIWKTVIFLSLLLMYCCRAWLRCVS